MTAADKPLPDPEPDPSAGPRWDLRQGDVVRLGASEDHSLRRLEFERALPGPPRQLRFSEIPDGTPVYLSDIAIAQLHKEGRFEVLAIEESNAKPRGPMPTGLGLTETERAYVARYIKYVHACLALGENFRATRKRIGPILQAVAEAHGEVPPSPSTALRHIRIFKRHGGRLGSAAIPGSAGRATTPARGRRR